MARFMRLDVMNNLLDIGVIPLFYNEDMDTAIELVNACVRGGAHIIEFMNRGELAYSIFTELVKYFYRADPSVILGIGSVIDAPTAALFLAAGANFVVGPSLNPEISRLCNRRKVLYLPGCSTENEITIAEELGAEICKIFPGESAGGASFIQAVMAPCPWHRLLPTGGVDATESSIGEWIRAGAAAVGMGSKLISSQAVKEKNYDRIAQKTADCVGWVQLARGKSLFNGVEHIGIYAHKTSPDELSAWYERLFDMKRKEGSASYFVTGSGAGRFEFPKKPQEAPFHIAIRVNHFESAIANLQAKGIQVKEVSIKPGSKSAFLDVRDPEGNLVHLLWLPGK